MVAEGFWRLVATRRQGGGGRKLEWRNLVQRKFGTNSEMVCEWWLSFPMGLWLVAIIPWRLLDACWLLQTRCSGPN